jgi:DNA invertase Pin-like site-specific DNA recombinase
MTQESRIKSDAEYQKEIDEIFSDCLKYFDKSKQKAIGATYLRHSTKLQDSVGTQLRENLLYANARGIFIPRANVFYDAAVSGGKAVRPGLESLRKLLGQGQVKVVIFFTSNRLFRAARYMLDFTAWCKEGGIRLIFHKSGLDSATDKNGLMTGINAVLDEMGRVTNIEAIRAAQLNLHRQGVVTTSLPFGFIGVPIPNGPLTRRSRPRCLIAIDPAEAEVVREIFRRYDEGLSKTGIVRWLVHESGYKAPKRSASGQWTYNTVSRMLQNRRYLGEFDNGQEGVSYEQQ